MGVGGFGTPGAGVPVVGTDGGNGDTTLGTGLMLALVAVLLIL